MALEEESDITLAPKSYRTRIIMGKILGNLVPAQLEEEDF